MLIGPLFAWCLYPVYLSVSGQLAHNIYAVVDYLPWLALVSAGTLAVFEAHAALRKRRVDSVG